MSNYYRIGASLMGVDLRAPIDPYADAAPSAYLGEGENHWTQKQFQDKAIEFLAKSGVNTLVVEITSNGSSLHSIPFDTGPGGDQFPTDAADEYTKQLASPGKYAWIGLVTKDKGPPSIVHDQMFASVTPLIHQTTVTKTVSVPSQSGATVAAGLGILGALGLLLLAAKAK